jgi:hypothetical protein
VEVKAEVLDPITAQRSTTNVFLYAFHAPKHKGGHLLPRTYGECMGMIAGRRIYHDHKARARLANIVFAPTTGLEPVTAMHPIYHMHGDMYAAVAPAETGM